MSMFSSFERHGFQEQESFGAGRQNHGGSESPDEGAVGETADAFSDEASSWAAQEVERMAASIGRPSIDLVKELHFLAESCAREAEKTRARAADERQKAALALEKKRAGQARAREEQAKGLDEQAHILEQKAHALLAAKAEEEKAVDALLWGPEKDDADDIRRAA